MDRAEFLRRSVAASAELDTKAEAASPTEQPQQFFAIVELMGHKRLCGRVTILAPLWQIDVPAEGGFVTSFFNPQSVYRITVTDEESVKAYRTDPLPAVTFELPPRQHALGYEGQEDDEDDWHR